MAAAMLAMAKRFLGITLTDKPLPEPEPVFGKSRPMTGFFASLTDEQKRAALAYRGDENHGPRKA
jgi:hypothetical protein